MTNFNGQILKNFIKKAIYVWTGICSILFGIVGTILPILPGLVFILLGLILLSKGSSSFKNIIIMQFILDETRKRIDNSQSQAFKKLLTLL